MFSYRGKMGGILASVGRYLRGGRTRVEVSEVGFRKIAA